MSKASDSPILRPRQARYLTGLLPPRDRIFREMESYAAEHDVPIARPELARLLEALAASRPAGRLLEVGTAIGYGALALARGAREGRVVTVDRDPERLALAKEYLGRAGVLDRVELLQGEALATIESLAGPFDLVYLDGDKREYRRTLDLLLPKLVVGGFVVVDNLLWKGRIGDPDLRPDDDRDAAEIERFNPYLTIHPQLASVLLPLGDGVGLAVKRKPTIREMGGPF
ncbi:MAG: O-methyltransferase [Thermoanaerobaculia bacterium]